MEANKLGAVTISRFYIFFIYSFHTQKLNNFFILKTVKLHFSETHQDIFWWIPQHLCFFSFLSFLPVSPEPPAFLFYSIDQHTQLSDFLPNLLRYKNCSRLTNLYNSLIQFTLLALNLYSVSYLCLLLHINPLQTHFILENGSNPMNSKFIFNTGIH